MLKNRVISSFISESTVIGAVGQMSAMDVISEHQFITKLEKDIMVTCEINRERICGQKVHQGFFSSSYTILKKRCLMI